MHRKTAIALLGLATLAAARPAAAQTPPTLFQNWIANLQSQGYTVTQGSAVEFTTQYCQTTTLPYFKTCFSSDPGDPYISALVPVGNGYIDPYFGGVASVTLPSGVVASQAYHLATNEAVVTVVDMPPTAAYFSYESYLFTRPTADYSPFKGHLSPDPARAEIFATFNNSISNPTILNQSGIGFGQGTVGFISTGNSAIATALQSSFSAVGGNTNDLFVEQWGNNLNFGLDSTSDDFTTVIRYSFPEDETAGTNWRQNAASNVFVYRIDAPSSVGTQMYGAQTLRNKSYNTNETTSNTLALKQLTGILANWLSSQEGITAAAHQTQSSETVSASGVLEGGNIGPLCIAKGKDCNSDQQDTDAYKGLSVGKVAANRLFIVAGVSHSIAATNNSAFTSLAISDENESIGVADIFETNLGYTGFSSGNLVGSAAQVLQTLGLTSQAPPALMKDLPNLYVAIVARSCTTQIYCNQPFTTVVDSTEIPLDHLIHVTERAYLLPGNVNGANPNDTVNPYVIY